MINHHLIHYVHLYAHKSIQMLNMNASKSISFTLLILHSKESHQVYFLNFQMSKVNGTTLTVRTTKIAPSWKLQESA